VFVLLCLFTLAKNMVVGYWVFLLSFWARRDINNSLAQNTFFSKTKREQIVKKKESVGLDTIKLQHLKGKMNQKRGGKIVLHMKRIMKMSKTEATHRNARRRTNLPSQVHLFLPLIRREKNAAEALPPAHFKFLLRL